MAAPELNVADGTPTGATLPARGGLAPARSLKQNALYAVTGMSAFYACQLAAIVLLAKFAPSYVLGQVEFSLAVATPVVLFCSLELRGAFVADAANEFTYGTYRKLRDLMMGLAGAVLLGFAAWEALTDQNWSYTVILIGMCGSRIMLSLAEMAWGLFQRRERLDLMAASAAQRGAAILVSYAVFVPLFAYLAQHGLISGDNGAQGAAWAIIAYVIASGAILLLFDRRQVAAQADFDPGWTWSDVWKLARRTLPLGIALLVLHLSNSIPIYVIERQPGGMAALGHYGALEKLTTAGNILVFQLANAAANRLSRYYQLDFSSFLSLAGKLLGVAMLLGLALVLSAALFGHFVLNALYRAEYAEFLPEFMIIILAQSLMLLTVVFGVMTTQMRLFWLQVPAQLAVLACTTIAALLLIPSAENLVRGGAWTVLVRASVHVSLYAACVVFGIAFRHRVLANRVNLSTTPGGTEGVSQDW
jgi:O-antigen/teichoic acid export membrane protein